jgi:hypothetical protein
VSVSSRQAHGKISLIVHPSVPSGYYRAEGVIRNVNTIEDYKALDKPAVLTTAARTVSKKQQDVSMQQAKLRRPDLGQYQ